jgi:hypothetical protein
MGILKIPGLMPPLRTDHDGQPFLLGQFSSGDDFPHAGRIDAGGFLHKCMFARLDGRFQVHRVETHRRRDHDHIHVFQGQQLLVGVEPQERRVAGCLEPPLEGLVVLLAPLPDAVDALVDPVLEDIRHRHNLDALIRLQAVGRRPAAPAAATDHTDPDPVEARGVGPARQAHRYGRQRCHRRRGGLHEISP